MLSFLKNHSSTIKLHSLTVGEARVSIPVADISGNNQGKTLLITAGIDGDEYASIEAAYQLIERYKKAQFNGRLIIIPIVNIPGFEAATPFNPIDQVLPYRVFPGKSNGNATEQLMHWVYKNYVTPSDVWIDLHGGYLTETLVPFVWTFETTNKEVNAFVQSTLQSLDAELNLYERVRSYSKATLLAKEHKAFFLFEAGDKGRRDKKDIDLHISWVEAVMRELGLIDRKVESRELKVERNVLRKLVYHTVPKNCLWYPGVLKYSYTKGELLGTLKHSDGSIYKEIKAQTSGTLLWRREGMSVQRNDYVAVLGTP